MSIISSLNISELFLSEDDVISEIMERWEEAELKFVGGRQSHVKFVLRSTYRLDLEEEKRIGDDTSMSLFFAEGMFHFVNGHYVLPFEDMTTLAAIIAKTKYGDWNSDIQYEYVRRFHLHTLPSVTRPPSTTDFLTDWCCLTLYRTTLL